MSCRSFVQNWQAARSKMTIRPIACLLGRWSLEALGTLLSLFDQASVSRKLVFQPVTFV